jgi:hypothetical protein
MDEEEALKPQLTHRGLMLVASALALAFLILVASGTWVYLDLRSHQRELARHERELKSILGPTPAQFHAQIERAIKQCLADRDCRRLFPQIRVIVNPRTHKRTITVGPAKAPPVPSRDVPEPFRGTGTRPAAKAPRRHVQAPKTRPEGPAHGQAQPNNPPSGPPPNPPPQSPPPVVVTVPVVPLNVCSPIVQVNKCPSIP